MFGIDPKKSTSSAESRRHPGVVHGNPELGQRDH